MEGRGHRGYKKPDGYVRLVECGLCVQIMRTERDCSFYIYRGTVCITTDAQKVAAH